MIRAASLTIAASIVAVPMFAEAIGAPVALGFVVQGTSVATTGTITTGADCPSASLVVVATGDGGTGSSANSVSDGASNSYIGLTLTAVTSTAKLRFFYVKPFSMSHLANGSPITVTFSNTTTGVWAQAWCVSGILATSGGPLDIDTGASGAATNPTITTAALAQAGEMVFSEVVDSSTADTYTPSSGMTDISAISTTGGARGFHVDYMIVNAATALTIAPSFSNSTRNWGLNVVTFKGAPGGGSLLLSDPG
jgi:hypothetical protein